MRRCNNCFKTLDLSNFYKKKDGYQYSCKDCTKEKVYAWRREKVEKRWDIILSAPTAPEDYSAYKTYLEVKRQLRKLKKINKEMIKRREEIIKELLNESKG